MDEEGKNKAIAIVTNGAYLKEAWVQCALGTEETRLE